MRNNYDRYHFPEEKCSYHYYHPSYNIPTRLVLKIPGGSAVGCQYLLAGKLLDDIPTKEWFQVEFCENENESSTKFFRFVYTRTSGQLFIKDEAGSHALPANLWFPPGSHCFLSITFKKNAVEVKLSTNTAETYPIKNSKIITGPKYVVITGHMCVRSFHIYKNEPQAKPISMTIPCYAQVGDLFTFHGKGAKTGERIVIDYLNTDGIHDNIWFHFDPRFGWNGSRGIIRNTYIDKKFQTEMNDKGMPLKEDQPYKLDILVEEKQFRCLFNDVDFCTYKHILPFKDISQIRIYHAPDQKIVSGITSVAMTRMPLQLPWEYGFKEMESIAESEPSSTIFFPSVPVKWKLPCKLDDGICICISGVLKPSPKNLKCVIDTEEGKHLYLMEVDFPNKKVKSLKSIPDDPSPSGPVAVSTDKKVVVGKVKRPDKKPAESIVEANSNSKATVPAKDDADGLKPVAISNAVAYSYSETFTMSGKIDDKEASPSKTPSNELFEVKFDPLFPFKMKGHFDLLILCHDGLICIHVDNSFLCRCQPYDDCKLAKFIHLSGDVNIKAIAVLKADPTGTKPRV